MSQRSAKSHKATKEAGKPRKPSTTPVDVVPPIIPDDKKDALLAFPVPVEQPKKQWWYRPPDSKTRKLAEKIAVMDAAGRPDTYIAKKLNTTPGTIVQARYVARRNGWWDTNDEPIDLEADLSMTIDRKIVRNISAALDGGVTGWQTHEMTIAGAKGRGIFKNHEVSKSEGTAPMGMIGIKIIMPTLGAADQMVEIPDAMCGGVPSFVDGDVIDGQRPHGPDSKEALPERTSTREED